MQLIEHLQRPGHPGQIINRTAEELPAFYAALSLIEHPGGFGGDGMFYPDESPPGPEGFFLGRHLRDDAVDLLIACEKFNFLPCQIFRQYIAPEGGLQRGGVQHFFGHESRMIHVGGEDPTGGLWLRAAKFQQ